MNTFLSRLHFFPYLLAVSATTCLAQANAEWELIWADEFNVDGRLDPLKWEYETGGGGWGNAERQIYTDELDNVRVEDGRLLIQARQTEGSRVPGYTSGRVITRERMAVQYGRIEVRAILPGETGTWPAIWMLSNDTLVDGPFWPDNGEIDIVETVGFERDPAYLAAIGQTSVPNVHGTVHTSRRNFQNGAGGVGGTTTDLGITEEFHVYALEWTPRYLDFFLDDERYLRLDRDQNFGIPQRNRPADISEWWPFDQRFFLILNVAVGGQWGGSFNTERFPESPYGTDGIHHDGVWPQTMAVDYVRVYRRPVVEVLTAPGPVAVEDYDREFGLLLDNQRDASDGLNFTSIQAGDYAEFVIYAASAGEYSLSADLQNSRADRSLMLNSPHTEEPPVEISLPSTEGIWQGFDLATISLDRGRNVIRLEANDEGFELGRLHLSLPDASPRYGFPAYQDTNVLDTSAWLGPVNVANAPFIYAPKMRGWAYVPALEGNDWAAESQYFYSYSPTLLAPFDATTAPWFYSIALQRWFYAPAASSIADLETPQWLFILN